MSWEDQVTPDTSVLVHWFHDGGAWWVSAGDTTVRYADRASAFEAAKELARTMTPSQLVSTAPAAWPAGATESPPSRIETIGARHVVEVVQLAGPRPLGRSVLVLVGADVPDPWSGCARIEVTRARLEDPTFLDEVRAAFLTRTPVVYAVEPGLVLPPATVHGDPPFATAVDHDFVSEAAWMLLTRNAVDARRAPAVWHLGERAMRLGAAPGRRADVVLPDGREAWCDGGALRLWTPDDLAASDVVVPFEALDVGRLTPLVVDGLDADLAPDQLAAVLDSEVRARIIAPAGSGKTRVLTERARHLRRAGVPATSFTVVAFNKRAQLEIVERTRDVPDLQVQTLNALSLAILNGSRGFAPRAMRVDTIDKLAVRGLLDSLVKFPRRANTDPASSWIDALSRIRLGLRSPRAVEEDFGGDVDGLTDVFPRYRAELARRGAVDFDEQIYRCLEVLLTEPEVRREAQRRCRLLLVDEFQDLTPAHMLLLRLLAGPTLGIFGVGDDDQTIYGYSGATPRWLVDFDHFVPAARHHALTMNYRCPRQVVTAASNLLSRNRVRVDKSIRAGPKNASGPGALQTITHDQPTLGTTERIRAPPGDGCSDVRHRGAHTGELLARAGARRPRRSRDTRAAARRRGLPQSHGRGRRARLASAGGQPEATRAIRPRPRRTAPLAGDLPASR